LPGHILQYMAMTPLTPAGEALAAEIARSGPIRFSRFMEVALYHPEFGYYRKPASAFGTAGDFYTAEQLQPVFGRLIARYLRMLTVDFDLPEPATVVELGAGRAEMSEALAGFRYVPVDLGFGVMPQRFSGIVFSNEFFDAVPVDVIAARDRTVVEVRVTFDGERFRWVDGPSVDMGGELKDGTLREIQTERLRWLDRIDEHLESGLIVTVDYGFTQKELLRFPAGTLMSYRRHQALDDVLAEPGNRDITAHVAFTELDEHGTRLGWHTVSFESLRAALLRAGESDQFAEALAGASGTECDKHRLQLKSLLFGMGEIFRVLVQRKVVVDTK
jgi:SAM-dependent MidA family methyltransferase